MPDPTTLQIEKAQLQDAEKAGIVTLIGQRNFKITCYFVNFLKNFKKVDQPMFDWQVIYFEAYLASQDMTLVITVTEKDLR